MGTLVKNSPTLSLSLILIIGHKTVKRDKRENAVLQVHEGLPVHVVMRVFLGQGATEVETEWQDHKVCKERQDRLVAMVNLEETEQLVLKDQKEIKVNEAGLELKDLLEKQAFQVPSVGRENWDQSARMVLEVK